ncbi:hypothetical protein BRC91_02040 [Halobacteriales archaeon QS_4_62_28]|nr:MAG: hypothetical protein BRC91_02040 [Halobacteriales archaeon QS_4_62_28]
MYTRRKLLKSTATGTALGPGVLTGSNSAAAATPVEWMGNGVNLQAGYTENTSNNDEPPVGWGLMSQQSAIDTVRIEVEPPNEGLSKFGIGGYKDLIWEANNEGLDVICTYHHEPYNGSNNEGTDRESLRAAGDWWRNNYWDLSQAGDFTVNLINEWGSHGIDPDNIGKWYKEEISKLRDAGYDEQVIVDCTGYAQDIYNTVDGLEAWLDWENIAIGVHVYGKSSPASSWGPLQASDLDYVANSSFPGIVGEFGTRNNYSNEENANVTNIVNYARDTLNWPVLAWAWNGDDEDWPMNMVQPGWPSRNHSVPEDQTYSLNLDCNGGDGYFNEMYTLLGGQSKDCGGGGDNGLFDPSATYRLKPVHTSNKSLDVAGWGEQNGTNIQIWKDYDTDNQRWYINHVGGGKYELAPAHATSKVMDAYGWGTDNGTDVRIWDDNDNTNQRWYMEDTGNDRFRISPSHASGKVLDVSGGKRENGTNVQLWDDFGSDNQRWWVFNT